MSSSSLINRGIDLTRTAAEHDAAGNYAAAHKFYLLGVEAFMGAMREYKNARVREQLRPKVEEYMARAEYLAGVIKAERDVSSLGLPDAPDALPDLSSATKTPLAVGSSAAAPAAHRMPKKVTPAAETKEDDDAGNNVIETTGTKAADDAIANKRKSGPRGQVRRVSIAEGERGHSFDSLFGELVDSARERVTVEARIATPDEVLSFVRFAEMLLVRRQRRHASSSLTLALTTDLGHVSESQRRASLSALLELDEALREHGVELALARADLSTRSAALWSDTGPRAVFAKGSLHLFHSPDSPIGSGGTQELLHCFATELEFVG